MRNFLLSQIHNVLIAVHCTVNTSKKYLAAELEPETAKLR